MADYSSSEVKSGAFITFSIVLLLGLTFVIGNFMAGKTESYQIRFNYVSGLESNAPVYFAGREVGKIESIEVRSGEESPILLKIAVPQDVQLRADSEVFIDTLGLMGEKFVELTPGTPATEILKPGSVLTGTDPIPMHALIRKMNLLADRMDELTASLNPMMARLDSMLVEYQDELALFLSNVSETSGKVREITVDHQEDIAKMISNLHETSANIRDMTSDLKFHPWRLFRKG